MAEHGLNIKIPKENLIRLKELENKQVVVKFNGGRCVAGELKSWDKSMNLIVNGTMEIIGVDQKEEITRKLGLIIVKGSQIQSISLRNGYAIIDNPFEGAGQEQEEQEGVEEQEGAGKEQQKKKQGAE